MAGGVILGIDPGVSGALAFMSRGRVETYDMPVLKGRKGQDYNEAVLARLLDARAREIEFAFLERQWARPTDGGPQAFKVGVGFGTMRMLLASNFIPYALVTPAVWKRFMGIGAGKDEARALASQRFPQDADQWKLKRHDGRAEAALIAEYGRLHPIRAEAA